MSMQVNVKLEDVREALQPLVGLKLRGHISGPPSSKLPLGKLVEALRDRWTGVEEYEGTRVLGVRLDENTYLVCHFGLEQPDDFCIALEGERAWERLLEAADKLSRKMNESFTRTLAALVHALQGIITGEEEEIEEISDPDQVIEELLTWLPEYVAVTD